MTAMASLRVDGVRLAAAGIPYSDLTWTDRADGGNFEASWSMSLGHGERPAPFFDSALVEVFLGLERRWYGELSVLDWNAGTFTATGMASRGYDFTALGVGLSTSTVPDTVIDNAITRGWRVTRPASYGSTPMVTGDATEGVNFVGSLLDQQAANFNLHWGVWGDGALSFYAFPTLFDYTLAPGVLELGETTEDTFNVVVCVYINVATGLVDRVASGYVLAGRREHVEDITNLGAMATSTAQTISDNVLAAATSSPGWTTSVEVSSSQLTAGGVPVDPAFVTAGQMIRAAVTTEAGQTYRDFVIGETKYVAGSDSITLSPVGKVASNFAEVIEDTYTRLTGTPVAA